MRIITKKLTNGLFKATVLLMAVCMLFTGCGQNVEEPIDNDKPGNNENVLENEEQDNISLGLENGFKPSNSAEESPIDFCAYKSDTNEFEIDDVTLDFFFGGEYYMGVEYELSNGRSYPTFDLGFADEDGNNFFVKHIEENFVSDKYSCEVVCDENCDIAEIRYNHSEQITIPSEMFTKENGQIWFVIYGANVNEIEQEYKCITGICIFYKVLNGKVILSNPQIQPTKIDKIGVCL